MIPPISEADSSKLNRAVREIVEEGIPEDYRAAYQPVRYLIEGDGKRLRPMLTIGAARACGSVLDDVIPVAAAVDILHNATLLHDDVIDNGTVRRGKPTANMVWSNKISILAQADMLFMLACQHDQRRIWLRQIRSSVQAVMDAL